MANRKVRSRTGSVLGALNILVTFSVMIHVSRCKIRNDSVGVMFLEKQMGRVLQAVFAALSTEAQASLGEDRNPFVSDLQERVDRFRYVVEYYGLDCPGKSGFDAAYDRLRNNINDPESIKEFQVALAGTFIADVYQTNSDAQEHLVDLFKICSGMSSLLKQEKAPLRYDSSTQRFYTRLHNYARSIGPYIRQGRMIVLSDPYVVICFLWSLMWYASSSTTNPFAPMQTETLGVIRQARKIAANYENRTLRREILDLEQLYGAIRTREVVSMVCGKYAQCL
jgi:hypothetical protein